MEVEMTALRTTLTALREKNERREKRALDAQNLLAPTPEKSKPPTPEKSKSPTKPVTPKKIGTLLFFSVVF